jgi:hypothetical protein
MPGNTSVLYIVEGLLVRNRSSVLSPLVGLFTNWFIPQFVLNYKYLVDISIFTVFTMTASKGK